MRKRGEVVERSFAHVLERGGMRRTWLRGRENVHKRYLVHVAGHNLGILMRALFGAGTPKGTAVIRNAFPVRHSDRRGDYRHDLRRVRRGLAALINAVASDVARTKSGILHQAVKLVKQPVTWSLATAYGMLAVTSE